MKAYKGFDKDLKCRGFQYEVGKDYEEKETKLCKKGFHACEYPLDCFGYYNPATSRFCEVDIECEESDKKQSDDTIVCGKKSKIGAELDIKEIVRAAFEYTKEHCTNSNNGGNGSALAGGDCSALTGGDCSALTGGNRSALTGGNRSALTGGNCSALTGGNCSALAGGDCSALTGGNCSALTGGYLSALTGGRWSVVYGGEGAKVRAGKGSVLALQCWKDGRLTGIKFKEVDGEKIKADTWYKLDKAGRFIKATDGEEEKG